MNQSTQHQHLIENDQSILKKQLPLTNPLDLTILEILRVDGPMTRFELVMLTRRASSTVYDSLNRLVIKGHVFTFPRYSEQNQRGRPRIYFQAATHF